MCHDAGMIRTDCRHWRADRPCAFNKRDGAECPSCRHVSPYRDRVLFIKLDAPGDVLRSASLLPAVAARHERPYIAWLTRADSVELVRMMTLVDEAIAVSPEALARIAAGGWTQVYSLSNDADSAALATAAAGAGRPEGFFLRNGIVTASNEAAGRWLEMAAFDRLKQANTETYQARMLAILGAAPPFAPPSLRIPQAEQRRAADRVAALFRPGRRPRIAVNVGAGGRWPKKMLPPGETARVIRRVLARSGADVVLVGGAADAARAEAVQAALGPTEGRVAPALTPGSISAFAATLMQADALFCGDTLALHVASAIGLPTLAVFGPTSIAEIADFDGLIEKVAAPLDCLCCYGDCDKDVTCMTALDPDALAARLIARLPPRAHREEGR